MFKKDRLLLTEKYEVQDETLETGICEICSSKGPEEAWGIDISNDIKLSHKNWKKDHNHTKDEKVMSNSIEDGIQEYGPSAHIYGHRRDVSVVKKPERSIPNKDHYEN